MNYKTIRTGISKNLVFIISMMILGVVIIIVYAPFGESEPQTSLLSYSCEELENKHISTDGPGGKFVIDQASLWFALTKRGINYYYHHS